jgi:hypothetical protein
VLRIGADPQASSLLENPAGGGLGEELTSPSSNSADSSLLSAFSPLALGLEFRKARGRDAEDADTVLSARSSQAEGDEAEAGVGGGVSWLGRLTRSGLSVHEDFELAMAYLHCDTDGIL